MSSLSVNLLGSLAVNLNGQPIDNLRANPARALLVYLAVERTRAQRREVLCTLLWPGMPEKSARHNLSQTLYALRQAFPAVPGSQGDGAVPLLIADRETMQINPAAQVEVDLHNMDRLLAETRQHAHPKLGDCETCIAALEQAAALYRGDFLSDFYLEDSSEFEGWAAAMRENYRRRLMETLSARSEIALQNGDYEKALTSIERQLTTDNLSERAHRQKIKVLALAGRRVEAMRQYRMFEQLLDEQLGTAPSQETTSLYERIRSEDLAVALPRAVTASAKDATPRHNLPLELTSFIGRENEISQVKELLRRNRLVTLTGVGGTGKTRLSLQVAGLVLGDYPNGVWLVELAGLADPAMVPRTVASALNLPEIAGKPVIASLVDFIREKRLLLLLDNCEHLLEACTSLADRLLRACPNLTLLASSREFLGVTGEIPYRLPPMALPDLHKKLEPGQLDTYDAVKLFVARARVVAPDFAVTAKNAAAVVQAVERLDGIPLAIELAAARLRLLSVAQVARRLDDAFRLLTGGGRSALPRHQTLRASIDWSYNLLSEPDRALLRRLSVFSGSWRLSAAEQVCADPPRSEEIIHPDEVLDLVTSLLDKSLIQSIRGVDGLNRFRMLETVRQYAHEKLVDEGEAEMVRDRHLAYYLEWVEETAPKIRGPEQAQTLDLLERELDNLRLALEWALRTDVEAELKIASALLWFWHIRSYAAVGITWLEQGLDRAEMDPRLGSAIDPLVHARALTVLGFYRWLQVFHNTAQVIYAPERAKNLFIQAITLYQSLDPERNLEVKLGLTWANLWLGFYLKDVEGKYERPRILAEEALNTFKAAGDLLGITECLQLLADINNSPDHKIQLFQQELALYEKMMDLHGISKTHGFIGYAAFWNGDYTFALESSKAALAYARQINESDVTLFASLMIGISLHVLGEFSQAEDYLQQSLVGYREIGLENRAQWSLTAIAQLRIAQGHFDQAAGVVDQAWEIAQRSGIDDSLAQALVLRSRLARLQEDIALALKYLNALPASGHLPFYPKLSTLNEWGSLALQIGDLVQASLQFREALTHLNNAFPGHLPPFFDGVATYAARTSKIEAAARLFGSRWCRGYYHFLSPIEKEWRESDWAVMRDALDEERLEKLYEEGKSITYEQAVNLVREIVSQDR